MDNTPDLAGALLRDVARLYMRAQRSQVACCDDASTVQCHVLTELLRADGLTQRALVERLNLDKGWISRAVDALVAEGAVDKRQSERDRRSVNLSLTAAGRARAGKLERQLNSHAAALLDAIPAGHHAQVQQSLDLLLQALQGDTAQPRQDPRACSAAANTLVLRPASAADWPAIGALLRRAALPLDGAREHLDDYLVGTVAGDIVCAGGLEVYGADALLRSVVVAPQCRGMGHGAALMASLMQLAKERGVAHLFLLTTTAADYFDGFGFAPASNDEVPQAMRRSREFQGACPASATLLAARVDP